MDKNLTYQAALDELNQIAIDMESEKISIDELAEKVKRASVLLRICNAKLKSTEDDVRKILGEIS
ncbi:MAG: exodeoxyribonuclease VII small subunit [Ferruginibacter sp.]